MRNLSLIIISVFLISCTSKESQSESLPLKEGEIVQIMEMMHESCVDGGEKIKKIDTGWMELCDDGNRCNWIQIINISSFRYCDLDLYSCPSLCDKMLNCICEEVDKKDCNFDRFKKNLNEAGREIHEKCLNSCSTMRRGEIACWLGKYKSCSSMLESIDLSKEDSLSFKECR